MFGSRLLVAVLVLMAGLFAVPAAASALMFKPPAGSPINGLGAASDIATGDFDEDGNADIAFAIGNNPGGLLIQLSNGDGTFSAGTPLSTVLPGFYGVWTGDFNGDSHTDILGLPYQASILKTFLGAGDGTFTFAADTLIEDNGLGERNSLAIGDLDDDGSDDFVAGNYGTDVTTAIANGSGGFSTSRQALPGSNYDAATIGDIDGDGDLDAAVASPNEIFTLAGDGSGELSPVAGSNSLSAPAGPIDALASADFDGDGNADVAASSIAEAPNGSVQTFLGQADAGLVPNPDADGKVLSGMNPAGVVAGDFNLDGNADVAYLARDVSCNCPDPVRGTSVALGDGEGGFSEAPGSPYRGNATFANVFGLATGDMNDDGALDLAIGVFGGTTSGVILFNVPDLTTDVGSISFAKHKVGTSSSVHPVELLNQGALEITVTGISLDGPNTNQFVISEESFDCEAALPPAQSCPLGVTFSPTSEGDKEAELKIEYAESETPLIVGLDGEGVVSAASVDPEEIDFGPIRINTTDAETVTVTSSGDALLEIDQLTLSGDDATQFSLSDDNCSDTGLEPDETCTIKVNASPEEVGELDATLEIPNDGDGASALPITAEGTDAGIEVTPVNYEFEGAEVGSVGQGNEFIVRSSGTTPLHISAITPGGTDAADFSLGGEDCIGSTLPVGETCSFYGIFLPQPGPQDARSGNFAIGSSADGLTIPVTGTVTHGDTSISPDPVEFGDVQVGETSSTRTITLTANGTASLYVDDVQLDGADPELFEITSDDCSNAMTPPGSRCEIKVEFSPDAPGDKSAGLIVDTLTEEPTTQLTGTGIDPAGTLTPASHDFGSVDIAATGGHPSREFTLSSTGATPLKVDTFVNSGDEDAFTIAGSEACLGELDPGTTCKVTVEFDPKTGEPGARNGQFSFSTNAGQLSSTYSGTATKLPDSPAPPPAVTSARLKLKGAGKVKRGKKLAVTATIENTGNATISGLALKTAVRKKFAKVPKSIKIKSLAPGATVRRTIKVAVKKKARAGRKLKVTVTASAAGQKLSSSSRSAKIKK